MTESSLVDIFGAAATSVRLVAEAGFLMVLGVLSMIDLRIGRLPDRIVLPTLWAGLVLNAGAAFTTPADAVLGAAAGYLSLRLLAAAYRLISDKDVAAFGGGDFKLAATIGAWLGVRGVPASLLVAFAAGSCAVLPGLLSGRLQPGQSIPFGPALAVGGALVLLAGPTLAGTDLICAW